MVYKDSEPTLVDVEPSNRELYEVINMMLKEDPKVFGGKTGEQVMNDSDCKVFKIKVLERWYNTQKSKL